jgi:hypothetical protein
MFFSVRSVLNLFIWSEVTNRAQHRVHRENPGEKSGELTDQLTVRDELNELDGFLLFFSVSSVLNLLNL